MSWQFLCSKHRSLLNERLEATAPIWASWMRKGEVCCSASNFEVGIQYFGCALDLSLLLIERYTAHGELDGQRHMERLLASGLALASALARCGHLSLRRQFLDSISELHYREQLRTPLLADRLPAWDSHSALALSGYSGQGLATGVSGEPGRSDRLGASIN
ncbi:hypothetical protein [Litorivivens sp.]|uniref:hypothetical protein n=1 Tax=Litorivivens sp. TaxID=2020868 RepID=UPI00356A08FB